VIADKVFRSGKSDRVVRFFIVVLSKRFIQLTLHSDHQPSRLARLCKHSVRSGESCPIRNQETILPVSPSCCWHVHTRSSWSTERSASKTGRAVCDFSVVATFFCISRFGSHRTKSRIYSIGVVCRRANAVFSQLIL
jgi:hypothetical protein